MIAADLQRYVAGEAAALSGGVQPAFAAAAAMRRQKLVNRAPVARHATLPGVRPGVPPPLRPTPSRSPASASGDWRKRHLAACLSRRRLARRPAHRASIKPAAVAVAAAGGIPAASARYAGMYSTAKYRCGSASRGTRSRRPAKYRSRRQGLQRSEGDRFRLGLPGDTPLLQGDAKVDPHTTAAAGASSTVPGSMFVQGNPNQSWW